MRLLVVEDDHDNAAALEMALRGEGFDVTTVGDGREALRLLETAETLPDAVLLDLVLPGLNGWELARLVGESTRLRHMPIIILSALSPLSGRETHAFRVLQKPVGIDKLLAAIGAIPSAGTCLDA